MVGLTAVLVAGCTGSGSDSGSEAGTGGSLAQGAADTGAAAADGTAALDPAAVGVDATAEGRLVVSTGTVAVAVDDLDAAGRAVVALTTAAGGLVTASGTGTSTGVDPATVPEDSADVEGGARYTLRVPGTAFESVLDDVSALGRATGRTTSATDVTAEVADVGSRVTSAQAVLTTFRDRLPQATSIPDVLALEGEIARRQADLEALQARQRVLADQVALASVEVTLTQADEPVSAAASSDGGFTGGLATGWAALGTLLGAVAVVLGVVLPFLVPVALVAGAVVLVRRRVAARARP